MSYEERLEPYEIEDCEVIKTTDDAILVDAPAFEEPVWFPRSQIHEDSELEGSAEVGDEGMLAVPPWLAFKQELI